MLNVNCALYPYDDSSELAQVARPKEAARALLRATPCEVSDARFGGSGTKALVVLGTAQEIQAQGAAVTVANCLNPL